MKESISIVLSGEAGQGLQTIEEFLVASIAKEYYVFSTKDVMSRIRGGNNTVQIRVASEKIYASKQTIDLLFLLNDDAFERLRTKVTKGTVIFGKKGSVKASMLEECEASFNELDVEELAKEYGKIYANTILYGFIAGIMQLNKDFCLQQIKEKFQNKSDKIVETNQKAFTVGFEKGQQYTDLFNIKSLVNPAPLKVLDGTNAVGIGALAGGCNFIASYPMSPGTGVLTFLAKKVKDFDVLVEQAEDEIAALNMVIGSWYTGARGLATTSGGGFALMVEAVSLSGMTETPCVVHIAQRPGPATGLPTRTEQADLNLAVYAGHGEFPRVVFAPGNLEDAVLLTQKAFYIADKYQVPVFILTDQYLLDSMGQMEGITLDETYLQDSIIETESGYKRYQLTENGISPRGIPGFGSGLVKVDSDEHDEAGQITESFEVRVQMNDKRLRKRAGLLESFAEAELIGNADYNTLIVGWGSTYGVLKEYVETNTDSGVAFLYVKQVYPLHEKLSTYFEQADNIIVVENNATGQLANLLKIELNVSVNHSILKYNGEPFFVDEVAQRLQEVL
ncbi:2-oxoacid:acceptor oxidoreductase subunit alpha [Desulfuribacillus alkaliarsenatis]|uniref:2-oxoacid:ferredoxin oxidoreductase subunit alpha n=1 Tax=Desulfuribacillus alkaliarsenatis TaxID=766136 RepID=A0A1E5G5B8_9FIRM|nr:2-oxoacid:acceptor oxidoreductase subunit alpha [Desulfuribacillus alkaliarsenatis]OEF98381.1 2-oxoacid:ferredoxin oxidoreductase subunit alpha [Desulfuribacillus alkaliarsenatis]